MDRINATNLHRKSGKWGTQPLLTVKQSKKVTASQDDDSVGVLTKNNNKLALRGVPCEVTKYKSAL
jgi:hypothetical protein